MKTALDLASLVLGTLPQLIAAGVNIVALVEQTNSTLSKAQAEGRDPSSQEWDAINDAIALERSRLHAA